MRVDNIFLNLNLSDLSALPRAVHLDYKFILIDNLNDTLDDSDSQISPFENYPIKLSFTIVMIVIKGGIKLKINLQEFEARKGDTITVLKGNIGEFCGLLPNTRMAVIAFTDEFFNVVKRINSSISIQQFIYTNPLLHQEQEFLDEAIEIYCKMKEKLAEADNCFREGTIQGYTQVLLYIAFYYFDKIRREHIDDSSGYNRNQEIYTDFMKAVQENYMRERSIMYYADLLCITPKYLSQVIKSVTGRLAGEWISDYVILEAKALLKSNKYTVQQVCDMLNFANQSFFGKYFKRKTGMSPKIYINS